MKLPFTWEQGEYKVDPEQKIVDLMDQCETLFEEQSAKAGQPHELQINVLWNTKDHKKALNPNVSCR